LLINVGCDASNDFLVAPVNFTIAYVDPNIAGKRVGEINTQLFSQDWPGDNESILPIVTAIVDGTIFSMVNAAITGLPDPSRKIPELWHFLEEPNEHGGRYAHHLTTNFDNDTAARWVKAAMILSNPTLFRIVHRGQQADSTDGAQMPTRGRRSYLPLDEILPPPAEDMIDDIGEESDDDGETGCPNPRIFQTTKTGFQMFERKLQTRIIRQRR
jgi:hypothetical protein